MTSCFLEVGQAHVWPGPPIVIKNKGTRSNHLPGLAIGYCMYTMVGYHHNWPWVQIQM